MSRSNMAAYLGEERPLGLELLVELLLVEDPLVRGRGARLGGRPLGEGRGGHVIDDQLLRQLLTRGQILSRPL